MSTICIGNPSLKHTVESRFFEQAGTKLGPDQLGSLDPGRINSDQPGSTRINPDRLNTIKEKGCLIKEIGYFYAFMD